MSAFEAVGCLLVIVEGLLNFFLSIHHEGPVLRNRLVDGLAANQHKLASLLGVKPVLRLFLLVGLAKQTAVHVVHQLLVLIDHLAFIHKDYCVPFSRDR